MSGLYICTYIHTYTYRHIYIIIYMHLPSFHHSLCLKIQISISFSSNIYFQAKCLFNQHNIG